MAAPRERMPFVWHCVGRWEKALAGGRREGGEGHHHKEILTGGWRCV